MSDDKLASACYVDPRNPRTVSVSAIDPANRDKCDLCFPDGTIPDDIDEVLVGHYKSKIHLTDDDHEVDNQATTPNDPVCAADGLAAKIGAEDFGPEDLEELASRGGDA